MLIEFETFSQDTDIDINLTAQNATERALLVALVTRNVTVSRIAVGHKLVLRFKAGAR